MHYINFFNACISVLITHHYRLPVLIDCSERVTGMMTDKRIAVSQDGESSNGKATKQHLIT